jgi:hypothetical protein
MHHQYALSLENILKYHSNIMSPETGKTLSNQSVMALAFSFSELSILRTCTNQSEQYRISKEERDTMISKRIEEMNEQSEKAKTPLGYT